jgi:5,10-methylenetetrahydrofolate reductase
MAKVTDWTSRATGRPSVICDYSPPRSGSPSDIAHPPQEADFISVAYNPGRAVRVNSVAMAATLERSYNVRCIFTLATRDMNRLALESLLLGAQSLGLENVIVVAGDPFPASDRVSTPVDDYRPTELIAAIARMNTGIDYRGGQLRNPTGFCIGATADLGRGVVAEARLAVLKVAAGADFLITQPVFDLEDVRRFNDACHAAAVEPLTAPIYYGVGLMEPDGVSFSRVPQGVLDELADGRSGVEIALQVWEGLRQAGVSDCYLVPPIRRSGARNYEAARQFLQRAAL